MNNATDTEDKFRIRRQGRVLGPFDRSQVERMIARRQLGPKDEIATSGSNDWKRIENWHRDRQPTPEPESEPASPATKSVASPVAPQASPEPTSSSGDWYVAIDGNSQGPIDEHTLGQWISQRRINAETMVWHSGMQDWKPVREVLPAALNVRNPAAVQVSVDTDHVDSDYAMRDLHQRRGFWVLTTCVITYIIAFESFAAGIFQIYTAVATRRLESTGLITISAISSIIVAGLLLIVAIEMTKLRSAMGRTDHSSGSVLIARPEHRVWMFAGLTGAFVLLNQLLFAIYVLIAIAGAT